MTLTLDTLLPLTTVGARSTNGMAVSALPELLMNSLPRIRQWAVQRLQS